MQEHYVSLLILCYNVWISLLCPIDFNVVWYSEISVLTFNECFQDTCGKCVVVSVFYLSFSSIP